MRCSHCDQALRAGATFCGRCGVPVRAARPGEPDPVAPASAPAPAAKTPKCAATLDPHRVAGVIGGALLAVATFLPWTQAPFLPAQDAFGVDVWFPLGVILLVCGGVGAALSLRGIGETARRGAASVAAAATALCVVSLDGGLDAAKVGAAVAVAGAVALAASVPTFGRAPRVCSSASGGPQFEEVV
jgi:hypothetical protein